jgi:hypothetical protein
MIRISHSIAKLLSLFCAIITLGINSGKIKEGSSTRLKVNKVGTAGECQAISVRGRIISHLFVIKGDVISVRRRDTLVLLSVTLL